MLLFVGTTLKVYEEMLAVRPTESKISAETTQAGSVFVIVA